MKKLKDCPCCGSKARLFSTFKKKDEGCRIAYVRCSNVECLLEGYFADSCMAGGETEQTAIDKWNRRVL